MTGKFEIALLIEQCDCSPARFQIFELLVKRANEHEIYDL